MPSWPTATNWPTAVNWPTAANWPTGVNWPASGGGPPPPINFASLFPGAFQAVQTDIGLTYGGILRATTGNTATTVVSLTGNTAGVAVPIWVKSTNSGAVGSGATFSIYYDGAGTVAAMTGLVPVVGTPIPLTDAGTGVSLTWTAGSGVFNNTWKATCAGLADQSGNGLHYTQLLAASQPILSTGLNGKPGLLFDGVDDQFQSTLTTNPLLSPLTLYFIARLIPQSPGVDIWLSNAGVSAAALYYQALGATSLYYQSGITNTGDVTVTSRFGGQIKGDSLGNDTYQVGPVIVTGNAGSGGGANMTIGGGAPRPGKMEFFALVYAPLQPYAAADAVLNTPSGYGAGAIAI